MQHLENMGSRANAKAQEHSENVEFLAKIGSGAKGALYSILGSLAVMAAIGKDGGQYGSKGVVQWVSGDPFGCVLLAAAAVGLFCYALCFVLAAFGSGRPCGKAQTIARRVGYSVSGGMHVALGVAAIQMMMGSIGGDSSKQTWLAKMMSAGSWGVVLVAGLGIESIGVGLFQFKEAAKLGFMNEVDRGQMSRKEVRYTKVPLSA